LYIPYFPVGSNKTGAMVKKEMKEGLTNMYNNLEAEIKELENIVVSTQLNCFHTLEYSLRPELDHLRSFLGQSPGFQLEMGREEARERMLQVKTVISSVY